MARKRTAEEIQTLLEGYRQRTGTRAEYCREHGISTHMLSYHLQREAQQVRPRMARVRLSPAATPTSAFALLLRSGRRIETTWNFRDADLARLIRVAEAE